MCELLIDSVLIRTTITIRNTKVSLKGLVSLPTALSGPASVASLRNSLKQKDALEEHHNTAQDFIEHLECNICYVGHMWI